MDRPVTPAVFHITKLVTEPRTPPSGFNCSPCGTRLTVVPLHDTRLQQSGTRSTCVLHCIYATHGTAPRIVYGRPFLPRCLCSSSTHQRASRCLRLFSILVPGYPTQKPCSLLASLGAQTTAGSWSSNVENLEDSLTNENLDT